MDDLYNIIYKIINKKNITTSELTILVNTYIFNELNKEPSLDELFKIIELIDSGIFNLHYMIDIIVHKPHIYKLYLCQIIDNNNKKCIKNILYKNN